MSPNPLPNLVGLRVTSIELLGAVIRVHFGGACEAQLDIETPATLVASDGQVVTVACDVFRGDVRGTDSLAGLLMAVVTEAALTDSDDAVLQVSFDNGAALSLVASPDYEAGNLIVPEKQYVFLPGGEVAEYPRP